MKNTIQPSHMIALGLCAMLGASFFAVVHVGTAKRQVRGMEYGFGSRKAPEPPPETGLAANFKRGAQTIADKAGGLVDDFFSWGGDAPAAGPLTASAGQDAAGEGADEKDPFEDFYNRNYGKGDGGSAAAGGGFSGASGGSWGSSGSSWGSSGGGGGDDGLPSGGGAPAAKVSAKGGAGEEADAGRAPRAGRPSVEDASGDWVKYPGRKGGKPDGAGPQLASLPSGGSPDGPFSNPLNQGAKPGKGGSLSEMPGQKGAADLNGASEQARTGAEGSYNSKMSGGASAAAAAGASAAGGGGVPAASAPKEVGADGKGAASGDGAKEEKKSSESSGSSSDTSSKSSGYSAPRPAVTTAAAKPPAEEEPDFLKTLMNERQKGAETDYIREEDAAAQPPATQLRSGALIVPPQQKRALAAGEEDPPVEPDPEKFSKLSADRKKEIKTEVHTFLRQVENQYGGMTDILFTPCSKDKVVCADHGLKMGFITMHTAEGARVQLSLKYVDKKWVPYTVSFGTTIKMPKPPAPPETPAENPDGGDQDGGDQDSEDGIMWV
ncbi:MAG: hypothetical protein PHV33_04550 [Elusimicrobiales bacterium]|nr:hypothetical protein [Elusimicrobiales bacterium]